MVGYMSVAGHALPVVARLQCTAHGMRAADMHENGVLQVRPLQATVQPPQTGSQIRTLQQSPLPARGPLPRSAGLLGPHGQCHLAVRQQRSCQRLCLRSVLWIQPWLSAPQGRGSTVWTPCRRAAGRWSHLQRSDTAHPEAVMGVLRR